MKKRPLNEPLTACLIRINIVARSIIFEYSRFASTIDQIDIAYKRRFDLENPEFELMFVEFKIRNINFINHLENCLDKI
jgi:hypothetical protein